MLVFHAIVAISSNCIFNSRNPHLLPAEISPGMESILDEATRGSIIIDDQVFTTGTWDALYLRFDEAMARQGFSDEHHALFLNHLRWIMDELGYNSIVVNNWLHQKVASTGIGLSYKHFSFTARPESQLAEPVNSDTYLITFSKNCWHLFYCANSEDRREIDIAAIPGLQAHLDSLTETDRELFFTADNENQKIVQHLLQAHFYHQVSKQHVFKFGIDTETGVPHLVHKIRHCFGSFCDLNTPDAERTSSKTSLRISTTFVLTLANGEIHNKLRKANIYVSDNDPILATALLSEERGFELAEGLETSDVTSLALEQLPFTDITQMLKHLNPQKVDVPEVFTVLERQPPLNEETTSVPVTSNPEYILLIDYKNLTLAHIKFLLQKSTHLKSLIFINCQGFNPQGRGLSSLFDSLKTLPMINEVLIISIQNISRSKQMVAAYQFKQAGFHSISYKDAFMFVAKTAQYLVAHQLMGWLKKEDLEDPQVCEQLVELAKFSSKSCGRVYRLLLQAPYTSYVRESMAKLRITYSDLELEKIEVALTEQEKTRDPKTQESVLQARMIERFASFLSQPDFNFNDFLNELARPIYARIPNLIDMLLPLLKKHLHVIITGAKEIKMLNDFLVTHHKSMDFTDSFKAEYILQFVDIFMNIKPIKEKIAYLAALVRYIGSSFINSDVGNLLLLNFMNYKLDPSEVIGNEDLKEVIEAFTDRLELRDLIFWAMCFKNTDCVDIATNLSITIQRKLLCHLDSKFPNTFQEIKSFLATNIVTDHPTFCHNIQTFLVADHDNEQFATVGPGLFFLLSMTCFSLIPLPERIDPQLFFTKMAALEKEPNYLASYLTFLELFRPSYISWLLSNLNQFISHGNSYVANAIINVEMNPFALNALNLDALSTNDKTEIHRQLTSLLQKLAPNNPHNKTIIAVFNKTLRLLTNDAKNITESTKLFIQQLVIKPPFFLNLEDADDLFACYDLISDEDGKKKIQQDKDHFVIANLFQTSDFSPEIIFERLRGGLPELLLIINSANGRRYTPYTEKIIATVCESFIKLPIAQQKILAAELNKDPLFSSEQTVNPDLDVNAATALANNCKAFFKGILEIDAFWETQLKDTYNIVKNIPISRSSKPDKMHLELVKIPIATPKANTSLDQLGNKAKTFLTLFHDFWLLFKTERTPLSRVQLSYIADYFFDRVKPLLMLMTRKSRTTYHNNLFHEAGKSRFRDESRILKRTQDDGMSEKHFELDIVDITTPSISSNGLLSPRRQTLSSVASASSLGSCTTPTSER